MQLIYIMEVKQKLKIIHGKKLESRPPARRAAIESIGSERGHGKALFNDNVAVLCKIPEN